MTPKEYLSRYRWLDSEINAKQEQCEELRRKAQTVSGNAGGGARRSQPYDRIGEITTRIVDLEQKINEDIDQLISLREQIKKTINAVPEQRLRTLLELRYINCLTLEETAERMNYSYSQICRLHGKALSKIKMI